MTVKIKPERRWSMKIIINRLNRHLPLLRPVINKIRYYIFRKKCPTYPIPQVSYSDGPWIDRKVTKDQQAIENYLETKLNPNQRLLHVGIGSSNIAKKWAQTCSIDGITVVSGEKEYADSLGLENYNTFIIDKNDIGSLKSLPGNYDYIIDNDIAAYSCCKQHFEDMMKTYRTLLSPTGKILAGKISVTYFDSGFPPLRKYLTEVADSLSLKVSYADIIIFEQV